MTSTNQLASVGQNWIDITKEFKDAAKELMLGELVHDEMFGLYDAMAAIELMDPKMDAGMSCNRKQILPFEERVEKNLIKVDNFTTEELIAIIDSTYSCLVAWLEGHSLAQTVLINLYLHNPKLVVDKTLKSFCIVILKIVENINKIIMQAQVFEEEDFQPKKYGKMAEDISNSKALGMIKLAEEELRNRIRTADAANIEQLKLLHLRIDFSKNFFLVFYNFNKLVLNQQVTTPTKEFILSQNTFLVNCEQLLKEWKESVPKATTTTSTNNNNCKDDHGDDAMDFPGTIGFEPSINQRLLPPSFPRYTRIKPIGEIIDYINLFVVRIKRLLKIYDIEQFFDVARFFNDYSRMPDTCVVTRSMLVLFYQPQSGLVLGERTFVQMIREAFKQFIPTPLLSSKCGLDAAIKDRIQAFFEVAAANFKGMLQIFGYNRARQREKIVSTLKDFIFTMDGAMSLDTDLGVRIKFSEFGYFQYWILFYKFWLMSQYLLIGFELELYAEHEFSYIYMELDYICDYTVLILKRASEVAEVDFGNLSIAHNVSNKNRKKQNKTNKRDKPVLAFEDVKLYFRGLSLLSGCLYRLTLAFSIEKRIERPRQNLNTEQIRYNHRFAPLTMLRVGLSYDRYLEAFDVYSERGTDTLYKETLYLFAQARGHLENVKEPLMQDEINNFIKLVKTNSIVINLMQSGHNTLAKPEFLFTQCPHFPIIKFTKT